MENAVAAFEAGVDSAPMPRWFAWFAIAIIAGIWWNLGQQMFERVGGTMEAELPGGIRTAGVAFAVVARLVMAAVETGFYASWWRLRSRRLPFLATMATVLSLSLLDAMSAMVRWWAEDRGLESSLWVGVFAGADVGAVGKVPGLAGIGILGVVRVVLMTLYQATSLRAPLPGPLAITAAAWIACRLLSWWTSDLMRGMSPGAGS